MDFKAFPSIPRLSKEMVITEKLDGTNACIVIDSEGNVQAQSRNRIITPTDDHYGFAGWVEQNKEELRKLGEGYHYGEWWGKGIQRGYGAPDKRFSLFFYRGSGEVPSIVSFVPELYKGIFDTQKIEEVLEDLRTHGSYAIPFMNPEGIVIYHSGANMVFKKTLEGDEGKWAREIIL